MPLAKINGIELYYETHGTGPALVMAHGAGGNHLSWWQQVPALSQQFRCVTFDHRGFGYSGDDSNGPGPNAFADDLLGLLDYLGIEKAALAGQSMGGWTVLGLASAHPERVSALVLCDTFGGMDDSEVIRAQARLRENTSGNLSIVLTRAYSTEFPKREPARCFLYQQISGLNLHVPTNLIQVMGALRHPVEPIVSRRIPTMLIVGEEDVLTPANVMELMARRLPHARFVKVAGAGHSVYFERPDEFNRLLSDFVRETTSQ
ncbi:MAG: alpha/beta fold hydrolase [Candidatus Binataceae bacterium]